MFLRTQRFSAGRPGSNAGGVSDILRSFLNTTLLEEQTSKYYLHISLRRYFIAVLIVCEIRPDPTKVDIATAVSLYKFP